MVNTRAGGAPADAEGITRAEDEEEGLNDASFALSSQIITIY